MEGATSPSIFQAISFSPTRSKAGTCAGFFFALAMNPMMVVILRTFYPQ